MDISKAIEPIADNMIQVAKGCAIYLAANLAGRHISPLYLIRGTVMVVGYGIGNHFHLVEKEDGPLKKVVTAIALFALAWATTPLVSTFSRIPLIKQSTWDSCKAKLISCLAFHKIGELW